MYQPFRGFFVAVAVAASAALLTAPSPARAQSAYNLGQLQPEVRAAAQAARGAQTRAVAAATRGRAEADRAHAAAQRARQGARGTAVRTLDGIYGNRRVEGEFNGAEFQGLAVDTTIDGTAIGDIYAGRWAEGMANGPGVYSYAPNENNSTRSLRYEGDNGNGNAEGNGVYVWLNGDRYEGGFHDNQHSGHGVFTWASDGQRYEGEWANGDREGWGVQWDSAGRVVHAGRWSGDDFVGSGSSSTATAASSGPIPDSFALSAAQEVLDGDVENVIEAFVWGESAQGHDYWSALYDARRLTPEATAILRDWVRRYQAGERGGSSGAVASVAAGPIPESFVLSAAKEVLGGDVETIIEAFVWGESAQGHDYWSTLYDARQLTPEATAIVQDWVRRYEGGERGSSAAGSAGPMPEGFLPRVAEEVLDGDTERLINAFVWGETQQGHDYWQRIYDAGGGLSPEAAAYLREWISRYDSGERPPG